MKKQISFIWFGSKVPENPKIGQITEILAEQKIAPSLISETITKILSVLPKTEDEWSNILQAQKINPDYQISLYIDSAVLNEDELLHMQKNCNDNGIVLVDIANNITMQAWYKLELVRELIKMGKEEQRTDFYLMASDILRILIMIYEGGYYFDCDCTSFPNLAETEELQPYYGFWQSPGKELKPDTLLMQYHFQASQPFNPVYILAIAEVAYMFDNLKGNIFGSEISKQLLCLHIMAFTGKAIYYATELKMFIAGKKLTDFVNETNQSIIFPNFKSINAKYSERFYERRTDVLLNPDQLVSDISGEIFKCDERRCRYSLELYQELRNLLPAGLRSYLVTPAKKADAQAKSVFFPSQPDSLSSDAACEKEKDELSNNLKGLKLI